MKSLTGKLADNFLFYSFAATIVLSIFAAHIAQQPFLYLVPLVFLFVYFSVVDFRVVFFLLFATVPFTREFFLPGNLGIDAPGEPVLIVLFFIYILFVVSGKAANPEFFKTKLIQAMILHVVWIFIAMLYSKTPLISIKFFLAKLWFVFPLVFLAGIIFKKADDFRTIFWCTVPATIVTILVSLATHYTYGFSFEDVNKASALFYRNHVTYSAFISLLMPFIWLAVTWYKKGTLPRYFLQASKIIFLVGTYFAFARGAWLALFAAVAFYAALKLKMVKWLAVPTVVITVWAVGFLITDHNYMNFAPEFEKAIYHGNIIDHLKATLKNQDISTAERFYRWVAGARMSNDYPATGYGPGGFYTFYKEFTVTAFQTYVSDNPEKSGVHNYFLMTLVEQGVPGFVIFMLLTFVMFYSGVNAYNKTQNQDDKNFIAALLCSMVIIYVQLMLSDLVESFKIGVFYFLNIALLANQIVKLKQAEKATNTLSEKAAA